jgi:hypothetical protein
VSKASSILICPTVPLRQLPDQERDVLRRFFTQHVRGMDAKHDKRWRRFIAQLWRAQPGEGVQLYRVEHRSGPFHKRHRAILERLFQSQERFRHLERMHDWLKVGAGFVDWGEGRAGNMVPKPSTTSFPECSEDDMREAHAAMVEFLHTERAQRFLWRHLKPAQRQECVDAVLSDPQQHEGA